jgi:hypothetical protein
MTDAVAIVHPRGSKRKAGRRVPEVAIPKRPKIEETPAPSTSRRSRHKSESESSEDEQDEIVDDSGSSVVEVPSKGKWKAPAKSTEGRKARKPTGDEASDPFDSWFDTPAGKQVLDRALAKRMAEEEGPAKSKKASGAKSSKK